MNVFVILKSVVSLIVLLKVEQSLIFQIDEIESMLSLVLLTLITKTNKEQTKMIFLAVFFRKESDIYSL